MLFNEKLDSVLRPVDPGKFEILIVFVKHGRWISFLGQLSKCKLMRRFSNKARNSVVISSFVIYLISAEAVMRFSSNPYHNSTKPSNHSATIIREISHRSSECMFSFCLLVSLPYSNSSFRHKDSSITRVTSARNHNSSKAQLLSASVTVPPSRNPTAQTVATFNETNEKNEEDGINIGELLTNVVYEYF